MVEIFGCGGIYNQSKSTGSVQDFMVTGLSNIADKVIPFFLAHPLQGFFLPAVGGRKGF
ncbi:MAG: endonuclease [Sphingomonadales bacterium]|nr:endonuclease [Sphingomonadales bacterium]